MSIIEVKQISLDKLNRDSLISAVPIFYAERHLPGTQLSMGSYVGLKLSKSKDGDRVYRTEYHNI